MHVRCSRNGKVASRSYSLSASTIERDWSLEMQTAPVMSAVGVSHYPAMCVIGITRIRGLDGNGVKPYF